MKSRQKFKNGSVLLPFIIIFPLLILIMTYFMDLAGASYKLAKKDQFSTYAQLATDAGIDLALQQINQDEGWAGTAGEIELQNNSQVRATYAVTVTNSGDDVKTVTAIGRSYRAAATAASSTTKINVALRLIESGNYSVVSGVGGLYLSNSAKIVGGDVFVNGEISLKNSAQIGLTTNPVNVEVAHQTCPNPATSAYPRLCASGENGAPISILNTAHIYGTVRANNQVNGAGMSDPGLTASSGVAAQALPTHDRDAQKSAVATTITGSEASCSGNQTRSWAVNTKITGDVSIKNNCIVTVAGNIWITGKLEVENSSQVIVSDSLGTIRPDIMIDGSAGAIFKNSAKLKSNSTGTGFRILTYYSTASCSPECSDVTGQDLYNSRNETTINLDNSAEGPQTIFYARWTRVLIANSGQIGALVGQTVELKNSGTITFGSSAGGEISRFWLIDTYRRVFD